jgi:hypothetical protein
MKQSFTVNTNLLLLNVSDASQLKTKLNAEKVVLYSVSAFASDFVIERKIQRF